MNDIRKKTQKSRNMVKNRMANLYFPQTREISPRYENKEDRKCPSFHNYSSDWYVWHYLRYYVGRVKMSLYNDR